MAKIVGLKENEYTQLKNGIKNAHSDCILEMEKIIKQIQSLNMIGGGLYMKELTPKVDAVIKELGVAKKSINSMFNTHEQIIRSFEKGIDNYDVTL